MSKVEDMFLDWLASFKVHTKKKNPYWKGSGYDPKSFLASDDEYFENGYKLAEKHNANNFDDSGYEDFYITGYDLKQAFLAGFKAGKKDS